MLISFTPGTLTPRRTPCDEVQRLNLHDETERIIQLQKFEIQRMRQEIHDMSKKRTHSPPSSPRLPSLTQLQFMLPYIHIALCEDHRDTNVIKVYRVKISISTNTRFYLFYIDVQLSEICYIAKRFPELHAGLPAIVGILYLAKGLLEQIGTEKS